MIPGVGFNNFNMIYQKLVGLGAKSVYPQLPEINKIFDFDRGKNPNAVGLATLDDVDDDGHIDVVRMLPDLTDIAKNNLTIERVQGFPENGDLQVKEFLLEIFETLVHEHLHITGYNQGVASKIDNPSLAEEAKVDSEAKNYRGRFDQILASKFARNKKRRIRKKALYRIFSKISSKITPISKISPSDLESKERRGRLFKNIDNDNSGAIDQPEFADVLKKVQESMGHSKGLSQSESQDILDKEIDSINKEYSEEDNLDLIRKLMDL